MKDQKTKQLSKARSLYFPKTLGTFNNFYSLLKVMKDIMYFEKHLKMLL
jgi:hypothetical protein